MLKTTLAGLRAHKLRLLLTAVAITLGVGFIGGTFVLTDTMDKGVQKTFAKSAGKVDVAVLPSKGAEKQELPAELLGRVRSAPGVTEARGLVRGDAPLIGRDGKVAGDMPTVGLSIPRGALLRYEFDKGRAPAGPGEVVLDSRLADREKFKVGDAVTVLDAKKAPHRFTVVGLIGIGLDSDASFRGITGFDDATALRMTGERTYVEIDVKGASTAAVTAAIGKGDHRVMTGEELGAELATAAGADTKIIRTGLLLFGFVAMLVSALVIYNTFSILIAQRMREMALLRCVGATRRQVFGSVVAESFAVGLVGSLLGLLAGLGLGAATLGLLNGLGVAGPAGPAMTVSDVTLAPRTILIGLAVGVVVTVLSALLPARAATRVAPVAALRSDLEPGSGRFRLGWVRTVLTVLFGLMGVGLAAAGALVMEKGETSMYVVAAAGALVFLAVIALMPALVRPLSRIVGALPGRIAGVPGRLAVENSRRSPRRTATTTIALTIGVGLMSLFAVIGASSKATSDRRLDDQFPMDFQIQTQYGGDDQAVPRALGENLRERPEIAAVVELREGDADVSGREATAGTITQSAMGTVVKPEFRSGSARDLRPGSALIDEDTAEKWNVRAGQAVTVKATPDEPAGASRPGIQVRIGAVYGGDVPVYGLILSEADYARVYGPATDPYRVFAKAADGVAAGTARAAVEDAARPYPAVKFTSAAELREEFGSAIDTMLMVFGALLGLAIVIALFGIANTLTLSVVERTRESALLRALGLTKRQLRRMLSVEALVMAVIGALTGVVLGVGFGWAATMSMGETAVFSLPYLQILGFMALAGVAGMLAAVLPARRAARASIVESLSFD
ncbi:ABC transporter permease [Actinomadura sp. 21ATH]|uniref:ABC transporter permease n=1 Tax=Actinomadura sp. 21ATH TaxID=1735444 RepID=UPI0035C21E20